VFDVLKAFLKLGLTSFGGPIAHLAYFRREFVDRRHWLDDDAYTDLMALCQFLPGPTSSQVGFSICLMRAGWLGDTRLRYLALRLPARRDLMLRSSAGVR
jgi:chromate transporter